MQVKLAFCLQLAIEIMIKRLSYALQKGNENIHW